MSPVNSLGSSANSSPGNGADPSHDPHSFSNNYRSLAYLPGSVHGASQLQNPQQQQQHNNNNTALPSITTLGNAGTVKIVNTEGLRLTRILGLEKTALRKIRVTGKL